MGDDPMAHEIIQKNTYYLLRTNDLSGIRYIYGKACENTPFVFHRIMDRIMVKAFHFVYQASNDSNPESKEDIIFLTSFMSNIRQKWHDLPAQKNDHIVKKTRFLNIGNTSSIHVSVYSLQPRSGWLGWCFSGKLTELAEVIKLNPPLDMGNITHSAILGHEIFSRLNVIFPTKYVIPKSVKVEPLAE